MKKLLSQSLHKSHLRNQNTANKDPNMHEVTTRQVSLPYINKISETTARKKRNAKETQCKSSAQTHKFKSIFNKLKDHCKPLDRNNVIYKTPCQDCQQLYIGETSTADTHNRTQKCHQARRFAIPPSHPGHQVQS